MKKSIKIFFALVVLFPIALILLVRFSGSTIKSGEKIILGYDKINGKFQFFEHENYELKEIDGPYIIDGKIFKVIENNKIKEEILVRDSINVLVNNKTTDQFLFSLSNDISIPEWKYELPEKNVKCSGWIVCECFFFYYCQNAALK